MDVFWGWDVGQTKAKVQRREDVRSRLDMGCGGLGPWLVKSQPHKLLTHLGDTYPRLFASSIPPASHSAALVASSSKAPSL